MRDAALMICQRCRGVKKKASGLMAKPAKRQFFASPGLTSQTNRRFPPPF